MTAVELAEALRDFGNECIELADKAERFFVLAENRSSPQKPNSSGATIAPKPAGGGAPTPYRRVTPAEVRAAVAKKQKRAYDIAIELHTSKDEILRVIALPDSGLERAGKQGWVRLTPKPVDYLTHGLGSLNGNGRTEG